uniref:F-box/LRR-repeat protein 2 n=1 Tax=Ciona intestinalis TaxID=7719 RepID=F7ADT2_CIOIN|nr:F-box/LRR-repeat protein 20 isoform X1 [Ciona intestinalis]|eukprot:XP_002127785.1 F-box/LRR-repeat protein 20 isoform X1 [Ciona intestinalis]
MGSLNENNDCVPTQSEDVSASTSNDVQWGHLPDEIWLEIFKRCPQLTVMFRLSRVCSKFRSLSSDPAMWRHIDLNEWEETELNKIVIDDENPTASNEILPNHPTILKSSQLYAYVMPKVMNHVKKLTLSRYYKDFTLNSFERSLLCKCANLTYLNMGFCENVNLFSLQEICYSCPNIECLTVEGCRNVDDACMNTISKLNRLTTLDISHCAGVTDIGIQYLTNLSSSLLHFMGDGVLHMSDRGVCHLVATHTKLETLVIDGEELNDVSIEAATRCLENLQTLHISFCNQLTDRSITALFRKTRLKRLFMKKLSCEITTPVLKQLFLYDTLKYLVELTLTDCDAVVDSTAYVIAERCPILKLLNLNWCCALTDEGIIRLTDTCRQLKRLHLVGLPFLRGSWIKGLELKLPNLCFLDLSVCNMIMDVDVIDLVQRKPDLTAYTYYHEEVVYKKDLKLYQVYITEGKQGGKTMSIKQPQCAGSLGSTVDF